ncbi:MAG TPA: ABC transporter ATP-binding protein [Candidatus Anaerostipes avistercoris]|uniref:ABC transporter ATP-binding protein n=1 Tax=Candidatus Anaerostipes avistercoris TaxID=2838462 RepID=A0A9D2PL79_9FIRM|nr:ABC transporter ATP-binding protein [Candidatus Anaerostipes avistercoris]
MYIKITDISKSYGTKDNRNQVLSHVSMELEEGKICVILGASGSGKSTLLHLIGALETADSGKIRIGGQEITKMTEEELSDYRRDFLGFVFQFYNLVPDLTVRENIEVCRYLTKQPLDLEELLKTLGLSEHRDKFPAQLSGGQQQRCSLARALVKNPKLLLCDEPTGALDSKTAGELLTLLEQINQRYKTTIFMVTHNEEIRKMAHKTIYLKDGMIFRTEECDQPISAVQLCL